MQYEPQFLDCHFCFSSAGIHLTNPLEVVPPDIVYSQLFSDSVLLVRRNDIINRWDADTDITVLMSQPDPRWRTMNVLGKSALRYCIQL